MVNLYLNLLSQFILKLLCFLNACDGVEDALKVLKHYYEIRKSVESLLSVFF